MACLKARSQSTSIIFCIKISHRLARKRVQWGYMGIMGWTSAESYTFLNVDKQCFNSVKYSKAQREIYMDCLDIDKSHCRGLYEETVLKITLMGYDMKYDLRNCLTPDPASAHVRRAERAGGWGARLRKTNPSSSPQSSSRSESRTALGDETQTP